MMEEEVYTDEEELLPEDGERQLYEHYRFVADRGQALLRVDKFLVLRIENASRNRIQQAAEPAVYL